MYQQEGNEHSRRLDKQLEKLRVRWKETEYRIVLEALEQAREWPEEVHEVRDNLIEWMINNREMRLVEEAEDMLDGLECLAEASEMGVTNNILMEATEIITAVVLARNLDMEKVSFQMDGEEELLFQEDGNYPRRVGRAAGMMKVKEELAKMNNRRKGVSRTVRIEDFEDMEVTSYTRRERANQRMETTIRAEDVDNHLVQDKSQRMVVVGADVEALYPSLEAIEVANIVFRTVQENEVEFEGIDYMEACKYIALTSTEQECRIGLCGEYYQ